jgi:DNA repair exonuclease SbcCD ATPase subunit
MTYRIHKGRYFYDLGYTFEKLKKEQGGCFVCGSGDDLEPHHLKKVRPSKSDYSDEDNVVIICKNCHRKYHMQYKQVNSKTFAEFTRKYNRGNAIENRINQFRKNNTKLKNENMELKSVANTVNQFRKNNTKLKNENMELKSVANTVNQFKENNVKLKRENRKLKKRINKLENKQDNYSNVKKIVNEAYMKSMKKVNDKIEELYDELTVEDKSLISIEDFASYFTVEYDCNYNDINNENPYGMTIILRCKTPEELMEENIGE